MLERRGAYQGIGDPNSMTPAETTGHFGNSTIHRNLHERLQQFRNPALFALPAGKELAASHHRVGNLLIPQGEPPRAPQMIDEDIGI